MGTQIQNISDYQDNILNYPLKQTTGPEAPDRLSPQVMELSSQLHSTLDINELVAMFAKQINHVADYDGIVYQNNTQRIDISLGNKARYGCNYQLAINHEQLGKLTFFRHTDFSEQELVTLENMLCALVYPLRNALLYHSAVRSAQIDPLTGVNNRSGMDNAIKREVELARRQDAPLSILLLDIDHFKSVNDRFGHACGDFVIQSVAQCISETIRGSDMVFRFGGEEFLVLLSCTDDHGAQLLAERIRQNVQGLVFSTEKELQVTASLGITRLLSDDSPESLFKRADAALYEAKKSGRNRVISC